MKIFYFTSDNGECGFDHIGNIRGAITKAQKLANELNETIYVNSRETEDILDVIYPDIKTSESNNTDKVEMVKKEVKPVSNYNKGSIMKRAWKLFKTFYGSFSDCLKVSWREAKAVVRAVNFQAFSSVEESREVVIKTNMHYKYYKYITSSKHGVEYKEIEYHKDDKTIDLEFTLYGDVLVGKNEDLAGFKRFNKVITKQMLLDKIKELNLDKELYKKCVKEYDRIDFVLRCRAMYKGNFERIKRQIYKLRNDYGFDERVCDLLYDLSKDTIMIEKEYYC